jgi:superfamily II DNA/RNA helicase
LPLFARWRSAPATAAIPQAPIPTQAHEVHQAPAGQGDEPTFASLGIAQDIVAALDEMGVTAPFPIQVMCIPDALAGRDVCGKAQTGSGKTLAFGLPLIERTQTSRKRRPRSLVLVPTRELANQICETLAPLAAARGLWIMAVYGGTSMVRQIQGLQAGVDIVVATPGRLNDLLERDEVSLADVSSVVLDEADQMADMGFLPQVERILGRIDSSAQTLLFSATLDGAIGTLVRKYQHDPVHHEVLSEGTTAETLEQRFIGVTTDEKLAVAARVAGNGARTLMFVRTTHGADRLVKQLARFEIAATPIHGRMNQNKRERALESFRSGESPILIATNVAARGLHVDGIDLVVHFDVPEDGKTYLHRSGRTARAGEDGMVVTLVLPEEERDVIEVQRVAGLDYPVVHMRANDPRLDDLGAWTPPRGLPEVERAQGRSAARPANATRPGRSRARGTRGGRGAARAQ